MTDLSDMYTRIDEAKRRASSEARRRNHRLEDRWYIHSSSLISRCCVKCNNYMNIQIPEMVMTGYLLENDCD